jgi:hypothetical protein
MMDSFPKVDHQELSASKLQNEFIPNRRAVCSLPYFPALRPSTILGKCKLELHERSTYFTLILITDGHIAHLHRVTLIFYGLSNFDDGCIDTNEVNETFFYLVVMIRR